MLITDLTTEYPVEVKIREYIEFIKINHNLQSIYNYYKLNKLGFYNKREYKFYHKTQYAYIIRCNPRDKYYVGETIDCFDRVQDYFNFSNINSELRDDLIEYGLNYFEYWLIPIDNGVFYQNKKIQDAKTKNLSLYNIQQADPFKSKKKQIRVSKKSIKNFNDLSGFSDIFG